MSVDWEAVYRDGVEACNAGDWDAVVAFAADDVELQRSPLSPEANVVVKGREAVRDFFKPDLLADQRLTTEEFRMTDDGFLVRLTVTARGAESGIPVELVTWIVYRVSGDLVTRIEFYDERDQAFAAAGL
jgi:hypothetical protein